MLATKQSRPGSTAIDPGSSIAQGDYRLDRGALGRAVERVTEDLRLALDIVVIDEIGPLELVRGLGYRPALDSPGSALCDAILLIVRPGLVGTLEERLRPLHARVVNLTRGNRDGVPARLLAEICGECWAQPRDQGEL